MSMQCVILSMNPGYDQLFIVEQQSPFSTVTRADRVLTCIGGKGVNVARVFATFGFEEYECINIVGGDVGKLIEKECKQEGIQTLPFEVHDESRINFIVIQEYDRAINTFNGPGPTLSLSEVEGYIQLVQKRLLAKENPCLIISGSATRGFSTDHLLRLISWATEHAIKICVDIGGKWLESVVSYPLELLKINREEFHHAFHFDPLEQDSLLTFKAEHHINSIIITDGKEGSYAWDKEGKSYHMSVSDVDGAVGFTVGCGDSFFAGYLLAMAENKSFKQRLLFANACGVANTITYGPATFTKEDVQLSLEHVTFLDTHLR